jgi:hypothetical protein
MSPKKALTPVGEVAVENSATSSVVDSEKESMRAELAELRKMVEALSKTKTEPKQKVTKDIAPNKYIRVMSLCKDKLNLSTEDRGKGKIFGFENFGDTHRIIYSELLDIMRVHPNFFEAGYFYILDPDVIELGGHEELYSRLLTKEKMEQILANDKSALPFFENTNEKQQKVVIDFLIEKINSGQAVDYNFMAEVSRISKVDIIKRAKEIKDAQDEQDQLNKITKK